MLSPTTIQIIKSITPAVAENAENITNDFYKRMFEKNPEVKAFFNEAHQHAGSQQKALAAAVAAYFTHIENPAVLLPAIEVIAQKHCSLQIKPEHYPIVGDNLLAAIKEVFGDVANDEVLTAVGEAYQALADILIAREKQIYDEQLNKNGGWNGYRTFTVSNKVRESKCVYSFHLTPKDGGNLPAFKPGQYIAIRPGRLGASASPRNYSLSSIPEERHLRISVKREAPQNAPHGKMSNFLHDQVHIGDTVQLAPPSGVFFHNDESVGESPIVFLAAGIGVTPLLSMAKSLVKNKNKNKINFLLAARNSATCAFAKELRQLAKSGISFHTSVFFDEPLPNDQKDGHCDYIGRLDREVLSDLPLDSAHFYICGPKTFMTKILTDLRSLGVADARLNYEFFGPAELN